MRDRSKPPNGSERPRERPVTEAVDRRLRDALTPPTGAAERIARRALGEEPRPVRRPVLRPAIVGLALAAVVVALLFVLPRLWLRVAGPASPEAVRQEGRAGSARYSITNRGDVIVVQALDGGASSLHSTSSTPDRPSAPPGMRLIVTGGHRP